jgi:hypothetical protein
VAAQKHHLRGFDLFEEAVGIFERADLRGNGSGSALVRERS